jgi:hypothetical protein
LLRNIADPCRFGNAKHNAKHNAKQSSVYIGQQGGLPFIATLYLHVAGTRTNTVVTVTAADTEIINGKKFGLGSRGPGQAWNCEPVQSTTVEEYTVLRYLGRYLGSLACRLRF